VLDATVITPRIVGGSVGIHPVWVVLALSVGGFFFGVVGLLVGVPAAAITKLLILRGLGRYRASEFYRGVEPSAGV
jgi:predicted PurR-regulated permease PerM